MPGRSPTPLPLGPALADDLRRFLEGDPLASPPRPGRAPAVVPPQPGLGGDDRRARGPADHRAWRSRDPPPMSLRLDPALGDARDALGLRLVRRGPLERQALAVVPRPGPRELQRAIGSGQRTGARSPGDPAAPGPCRRRGATLPRRAADRGPRRPLAPARPEGQLLLDARPRTILSRSPSTGSANGSRGPTATGRSRSAAWPTASSSRGSPARAWGSSREA